MQAEIVESIQGISQNGVSEETLSHEFSQLPVQVIVKTTMAARFPEIATGDSKKPWYCQIKTKFDRLSTSEPTFLRSLVSISLMSTTHLAESLSSATGRAPTQEDYSTFLDQRDRVKHAVYQAVRVVMFDEFNKLKRVSVQFEQSFSSLRTRLQGRQRAVKYRRAEIRTNKLVPSSHRVTAPPPAVVADPGVVSSLRYRVICISI